MSCITYHMLRELKANNFTFPAYEHMLNLGMVYFYQGQEYYIGGFCSNDYSETDKLVARNGVWLPDEGQLLEWLELVGFDVVIRRNATKRYNYIEAVDCVNGEEYKASGPTLDVALWKLIIKICKSRKRPYIPAEIERLEIDY